MTMERRATLLRALKQLEPVLRDEGVVSLSLFGSRARGDARADSDVDVLIDVDQKRRFSLLDVVGVAQVIQDAIGLEANVFVRRGLDQAFLQSANRDAVVVYQ